MKRLLLFLLMLYCETLLVSAQPGAPAATGSGSNTPFVLDLQNRPLNDVLKQYGMVAHRTLLVAPNLTNSSFSLQATCTNNADAARILADALKTNGLLVIPDGDKFVMVIPESMKSMAVPHSAELKPAPQTGNPGTMDFTSIPIMGMLKRVYLPMAGRRLDTNAPIPRMSGLITLRTASPLTKQEVVYALETLFAWNNVKVIPLGEHLARLELINPPHADH